MQFESTPAIGKTARGVVTRLIMPALSTIEVVPLLHAIVKKLKGTRPQRTNTGNFAIPLGNRRVKTKVRTLIITSGFRSDHNTPKDMFR